MSLTVGEKLGPYEILAPIGAGGMGEVFRARDPRMGREVAIKISAERFSERFDREVRAIASLNHPNICTLYDVGPNYLVMELIDGPTLGERISSGAIPLEESLNIARQIADALEAAHEKGIVHRDLKPGNVKITSSGTVKVLDFGLAKMGGTPSAKTEDSPTISLAATQAGVILGTASYMSPEQARGKVVDKRADIWAFGVVLYEMLTGKRLFEGDSVSELLAGVLKEQPDLTRVPARVRPLLQRCLEKDPKKRLRDIGDMGLLLEGPERTVAATQTRWLWPSVAGLFVLTTLGLAAVHFRETPVVQPVRFQIQPPEKANFEIYVSISPDGKRLAFTATGADGATRVWVRDLETLESRPLNGTEGVSGGPFWSPDSKSLAFAAGRQLKKVEASGGPPQTLCEVPTAVGSGSWSKDDVILFGSRGGGAGLNRVSASGGVATPVTKTDASRQEVLHSFPAFLPDGKHFLYLRAAAGENGGLYVGSLDNKPEEQATKRLMPAQVGAVYVPSSGGAAGRLLFLSERTLMAQSFDASRLELAGEAVPVAEQIGVVNVYGVFSASENGILAYRTGGAAYSQLNWVDREGKVAGTAGEAGQYLGAFLSPDAKQVALTRLVDNNIDVWLFEFARGVTTRFTFNPAPEGSAVWSPEGKRIAFQSSRGGVPDLYQKASDGSGEEELLLHSDQSKTPTDWSRDGRYLLYYTPDPKTGFDLWLLPLQADASGARKPIPLLRTEFDQSQGHFSPDMRWIAYTSTESGRSEIYVRPFTAPASETSLAGGKWQVSRDGGIQPHWRADGKELFFRATDGSAMAVDITAGQAFQSGAPKRLFQESQASVLDVTPDGKQFLVTRPVGGNTASPITVVLNWEAGLKK